MGHEVHGRRWWLPLWSIAVCRCTAFAASQAPCRRTKDHQHQDPPDFESDTSLFLATESDSVNLAICPFAVPAGNSVALPRNQRHGALNSVPFWVVLRTEQSSFARMCHSGIQRLPMRGHHRHTHVSVLAMVSRRARCGLASLA